MNVLSKFRLFLIVGVFAMLCASCKSSSDTKKVGLLLHDIEGRWIKELEYLKKAAESEGIQLIVKTAGNDENVQLGQTDELIDEGAKAIIVVAVNQNTAAGIVRKAHSANIPLIAYDRIIRNSDLDYLITYDYAKIGEIMLDYAVERKPKGNYVFLWGDASDANARAMQNKQIEIIQPYIDRGDINTIYRTNIEDWSDTYAKNQMEKIVNFSTKQVDVIVASNDVIAQAAAETLEEYGVNADVIITGQDATIEGCQMIAQGRQTMTVYKSTINMAHEAMALASKLANKDRIEKPQETTNNGRTDVPTFFLEPKCIDKSNLMATVIADGVFTQEEVYGK